MENQNNVKDKNEGAPRPGNGNRRHHRGGRGRGGNRGQDIKTKPGNYINEAPAAQGEGNAPRAPQQSAQGNRQSAAPLQSAQGNRQSAAPEQNAQGGNKRNRNRRRGGGHRERAEEQSRPEVQASGASDKNELKPSAPARPMPTFQRTVEDKWLDDTFSPLHEVETVDPDAEETARRILDAEGPLLFREERVEEPEIEDIPDGETVEIVGIRFKTPGKVYFFAPGKLKLGRGSYAIVETARGEEYGEVCRGNTLIPASEVVQPLRPVLREATEADARHNEQNKKKEDDAFRLCQQKIAEHGLDMKLVEAQYTFDNSKLLFYFTSDGRVDFRELVKDLAGLFRTRIELRQIGIRDEAKLLGGLGTCGRALCCSGFLPDFVQVSIKMAKEQNLSLNSTKISGCCGRLMCCLRYEFDTYETEIRLTPSVGSTVETPDGMGNVIANNPLKGTVTVRLAEAAEEAPRTYHRDTVRLCRKDRAPRQAEAEQGDEPTEGGAQQ